MEPLNLNTLASSLQAGSSNSPTLQNAEQELLNNFKAAALSITTLYRSSRHTSERAYNAGYATACQDLLMMIQQSVSVGASQDGMNIGRVMDWIEARLDAIKSREEEQDEDEEREKSKSVKPKPATVTPTGVTGRSPTASTQVHVPRQQPTQLPKVSAPLAPPLPQPQQPHRDPEFTTSVPNTEIPSVTAGAKRRHAVMMMLDSTSPTGEPSLMIDSTPSLTQQRRRTRSSARMGLGSQPPVMVDSNTGAMDVVELEEGRERKRPTRR